MRRIALISWRAANHEGKLRSQTRSCRCVLLPKANLAGPHYAADKPVFILIGRDTASGCESFAYMMQAQTATLIGEHSAGAAHFRDPHKLSDHFVAFVPVGRPIDPITHGDREGTRDSRRADRTGHCARCRGAESSAAARAEGAVTAPSRVDPETDLRARDAPVEQHVRK